MSKRPKIISHKLAAAAGLPRYFTGKPCLNGNIAERRTNSRNCLCAACRAEATERAGKWKAANQEEYRAYLKQYRDAKKATEQAEGDAA